MGGANGPASMAWVGSRMDLGADVSCPIATPGHRLWRFRRSAAGRRRQGVVPDSSLTTRSMGNNWALGHRVRQRHEYDLPAGQFQCPTPTSTRSGQHAVRQRQVGVDLAQLVLAPTVACKLNRQHSVGASLLLGYQR
jgi:long-chain fatty acid transport protein